MSSTPLALITGCSSGIGFDLVGPLLERGYRVVATMRRADERRGPFQQLLQRFPGHLTLFDFDVTDSASRVRVVEYLQREHGELDVLVNNAGLGVFGALEHVTEEEIRGQLEVNVVGLLLLTQACLPLLRRARGRVINISSVLGVMGLPLTSLYCMSKFAVEGLSEALYHELAPYGVQVCSIEPGGHRTNFSQNIRWGSRSIADPEPYVEETRRYREDMRSRIDDRGVPAHNVVKTILRVLGKRRMPLRAPCGLDSRSAILVRKVLPSPVFLFFASIAIRVSYYRRRT